MPVEGSCTRITCHAKMFSTGTLIKQGQDLVMPLRQGAGYATDTVYLVSTRKVSIVVMRELRISGYRLKL